MAVALRGRYTGRQALIPVDHVQVVEIRERKAWKVELETKSGSDLERLCLGPQFKPPKGPMPLMGPKSSPGP